MPKKLSSSDVTPTLVQERLVAWGRSIRAARLKQRITVADLCERIGISEATLRRLERGDPGAAAGTYLTALLMLGLFDEAVPALHVSLGTVTGHRVRRGKLERGEDDGDYF
ncbi:helix-turn-helix domain-containing protein [Massilia dura]|uniref:Helix-turn-helix domain-containing protein n=1 Tax=Pseudoduganella dura TaxID=321982 RepID=A0A6I3XNY2_9BURK|nr:helix-turn-helix transcriptional regulator [Pseudoduganella dura]MUI13415.1 helix-turn-helix domain-containing protein [Pseudoduganella dura]GGX83595.1 transcriptional regulator [Pseudoduganella dura]